MSEDILRELLKNPGKNYDSLIEFLAKKYPEISKVKRISLLILFIKKKEEEKKEQELVFRQEDYDHSIFLNKVLSDIPSDVITSDQKKNIRETHKTIISNNQCDNRTDFIEALDDTINKIDSSTNDREYIINNIKSGSTES